LIGDIFHQAIAGNHAEADATDQADIACSCLLVTGEEVLQSGNFPREIQVMGSGCQAGLNERRSSGDERRRNINGVSSMYCH
jgi:hypothetical protein